MLLTTGQCIHFDLSLFEAAYRAAQLVQIQPTDNGFHPAPASPYRSPLGDSSVDLRGVGTGQNSTGHLYSPYKSAIPAGRDEPYDFDLSQNQPLRPDLESVLSAVGGPQPPVPSHSSRYPLAPSPPYLQEQPLVAPAQHSHEVPVGKQVRPYAQQWVCLWASTEYGSSLSRGELGPCNRNFDNLENLKQHFATCHVPFRKERHSWRCFNCQLELSSPTSTPCLQCCQPFTWHEWCWARLSVQSSPPSLSHGPVASHDGSPSSPSPWDSSARFHSPAGGHNNSWTSPFGGYGHSNGPGPGYSYSAAHAASSPASKQSTSCCEKTTAAPCHPGSSLIADMWPPRLYSNKHAGKTALLRHACPAAVVFAVFLIAVVNSWLFTGRGRGRVADGVDHVVLSIVSSIFLSGQIKVLDLAIVFIAAGVFASWLVRHVKSRWKQKSEGRVRLHPSCVSGW